MNLEQGTDSFIRVFETMFGYAPFAPKEVVQPEVDYEREDYLDFINETEIDASWRITALDFAIKTVGKGYHSKQIIDIAKEYYDFISASLDGAE